MKKYLLRYLILLVPAALAASFFNNPGGLSQAVQWACTTVMILGWAINTGMAAYHYPRAVLSLLFFYTGLALVTTVLLYDSGSNPALHSFMATWGGLLTFIPIDVIVIALLDFRFPQELVILGFVITLCVVGYIVGLVVRRTRPNPYRPRIQR